MNKIPVGQTIGRSYGFAIGHYLRGLSVVWLPALLLNGLMLAYREQFQASMMAAVHSAHPMFSGYMLLIQFLGFLAFSIIAVGLTKEMLGLPRGPRFFYIGFGAAELRVLVSFVATFLLYIVFVVGVALGVALLGFVAAAIAKQPAAASVTPFLGIAVALLALIGFLAVIVVMVRLTFLMIPVAVAEKKIGLTRSWQLTSGSFWRILVIGIAVLLPLIIASIALAMWLLGPGYIDFVMQHRGDPAAVQAYVSTRMDRFYTSYFANYPLILIGGLLISPIMYALIIGPSAFAYRALMPVPMPVADVPLPAPAPKEDSGLPKEIEEILDKPSDHGEDEKH